MSDGEVPEDRCGFVLEPEDVPEDIIQSYVTDSDKWYKTSNAVCCWREVWDESDDGRCIWHATTDDKPAKALVEASTDRPERLDGANVPDVELSDTIDFDNCGLQATTFDGTGVQGASFVEIDGRVAQFHDANLMDAKFHNADLMDAKFHNVNLWDAQFPDANLFGVQFLDAELWDAQFASTDLRNAQFPDADLEGAKFPDADLGGAHFPDTNLKDAQFPDANLDIAQFPKANLWGAKFPRAFLHDARFPDANLGDAQFTDADLRRARFPDAFFMDTCFLNADVSGAQFSDVDLTATDFTDATATDVDFTSATLEDATLTDTDLANADLTDARLHDAHLRDVRINEGTDSGDLTPDEARATRLTPGGVHPYVGHTAGAAAAFARQLDYEPRRTPSTDSPSEGLLSRLATLPVVRRLHDTFHPKYEAARRWWFWYRTDRDALDLAHDDLGKANTVYRTIQRLYRENSMPRRIDTYHVRARDTRRKQAIIDGDLGRWAYLAGQRWVMGYGECPWRVVATSGLVILGCAVAYPLVGGVTETATGGGTSYYVAVPLPDVLPAWVGLPGVVETVLTSLYFSVVTFTTLGYGDLRPRTGAAQFLATFESLVGAFLLALLVYVLGRRATR